MQYVLYFWETCFFKVKYNNEKEDFFFQFVLNGMCSLLKSAFAVRTPTFLYSPSDYILQRYIFSYKYVYKKSKSSDLGFSSSFYLKLVGHGCCD